MGLKMWNNGDVAEVVYKIIEHDFKLLGRYLSNEVRSLTTAERNSLHSDYLSEGLVVFDKDQKRCLEYCNGKWKPYGIIGGYTREFSESDWANGEITIRYDLHLVPSPTAQVFILHDGAFQPVIGGYFVKENHNIVLTSDIPFDGKVVIK